MWVARGGVVHRVSKVGHTLVWRGFEQFARRIIHGKNSQYLAKKHHLVRALHGIDK